MGLEGHEKAVIFLNFIGEKATAEILKNLDVEHIGKITEQVKKMDSVEPTELDEVVREVLDLMSRSELSIREEVIEEAIRLGFGEEAETILQKASAGDVEQRLKSINTKKMAEVLASEHPQTVAFTLCILEAEQAAQVLAQLPDDLKAAVALRIASIKAIPPETKELIETFIASNPEMKKASQGTEVDGPKTLASILNHCDKDTESLILTKISEEDEELAESVRDLKFVFDDLIRVDDSSIQLILREVSTDVLAVALKTASEVLRNKIFNNMSRRAASLLKEEIEMTGPVRVADVQKAQKAVIAVARKLEEEGKIVLSSGGGEEFV